MDLTVTQSSLHRALRLVARIVPSRVSLPILQTVLVEASPDGLTLTATDAEMGVVTRLAADITESGRVAVPARLLGETVAQLPAEPVRLSLDGASHRARVACGRSVAHLATLGPADFPVLPATGDSWVFDLEARRLRQALDRVGFAASRDTSRPTLGAVLFDFRPDGLTLAAADGFRLARARLPEAGGTTQALLVPARAVAEFSRLLAEGQTARLSLTPDARGLYLTVGATTLFTLLVEGRFPDIERVIPQAWRTRVTLETTSFRQAVQVASLFGVNGDTRPVVMEAEDGRLRLHARGDETGEAETDLPAAVEGEAQDVVLNTRLLTDLLAAVSEPQLQLAWTSAQSPVVVREIGGAADDVYVVMPLSQRAAPRREAQAG